MVDKELAKVLVRKLKKIRNDDDFILGVGCDLKTNEHVQLMIDWLTKHENEEISSSEVLLKSLEIEKGKKFEVNGLITRT